MSKGANLNLWSRFGTGLLGLAGLVVAALMGYAALFAGWRSGEGSGRDGVERSPTTDLPRVAVFLPSPADWADFRLAVKAGAARGVLRVVKDEATSLAVESTHSGRRLRFDHQGVRGVNETRSAVVDLARQPIPPLALIGSTTTVLTVALAEPLRALGDAGPLLLIPWATAVDVERADATVPSQSRAARGQIPLIEVDPGRTFRFCPNNRALADSVVDCLISRDAGRLPARVYLVVDPFDPYSDDLAAGFRRAIRARKPDVEIVERADAVDLPSFARPREGDPDPSPAEVGLADSIVASGEADPARTVWVVLPLQDQPARRMIVALRRRMAWRRGESGNPDPSGPAAPQASLRVVCGDAIERAALTDLARRGGLSIWCASTTAVSPGDKVVSDDTQALAEIVTSLVLALDGAGGADASGGTTPAASTGARPTPSAICAALRRLDLAADDPRSFGRPLAFDASGERQGDPTQVVAVLPELTAPVGFVRTASGHWEPTTSAPRSGAGPSPEVER